MIKKSTCKALQKIFSTLLKDFPENFFRLVVKLKLMISTTFFMQVGQSLATDVPCNFTTADIEANEKSFFFCLTDESEVSIVIEKLKNKTSDGHDGLNNRMVKFCASII